MMVLYGEKLFLILRFQRHVWLLQGLALQREIRSCKKRERWLVPTRKPEIQQWEHGYLAQQVEQVRVRHNKPIKLVQER